MRKFFFLLLLVGCTAKETKNTAPKAEPKKTPRQAPTEKATQAPAFFSLFEEVSFDTLHIFSAYSAHGGMRLKGVKIPAKFYPYFPKEVKLAETQWGMGPTYACYRFPYSPDITALIVNTPSEYDATAYDLYLYSHAAQKIVFTQRIADTYGDAGEGFIQDSWLLKLDKDSLVDIVTKTREIFPEDEALTKFSYSDKTTIFLGSDNRFDSTNSKAFDTRSFKVHTTILD